MLCFLLDENLSPKIATQIKDKRAEVPVISLYEWREGVYQAQDDEVILHAAHQEGLTLVTYDQKTILPLLARWGQAGTDHSGVVFIDNRSLASSDFGAIIRAIIALWDTSGSEEWVNRVAYLRSAPEE